jgi:hypothetical protein
MAYDPNMDYNQVGQQATVLPPPPGMEQQTQGQSSLGLLPQKCTTPEGMPGTWNGMQCIPDTGTTMPGGGTGTQPPCTMPDGTPGVTAPSGNCVPSDFQPGPGIGTGGGCPPGQEMGFGGQCQPVNTKPGLCGDGMIYDKQSGKCVPDRNKCTTFDGQPGKIAPSGNCVPIDTVTYNPGKEGCEFGGGRWDEATQTCLERGENNCYPGEVFHPFAGCVPDTGQDYDDWGDPPTPPADYTPCTAPDGSPGFRAPSGNCVAMPDTTPEPGWDPNMPDPGDPFDVGESPDPWDEINKVEDKYGTGMLPDPDDLDYDAIDKYVQDHYNQTVDRYIQPQEDLEMDRHKQELINMGIDPDSDAGRKALNRLQVGQNDRRAKAWFDAMTFGRDTQKQLYDQAIAASGLAQNMAQFTASLGQRAHEFGITAGMTADELNWNKISDVMGWDYQSFMTWRDENRWIDNLILTMAGATPVPNFSGGGTIPWNMWGGFGGGGE